MVNNHSEEEIEGMQELICQSIREYLTAMGFPNVDHLSKCLVENNKNNIIDILNKPLGGTLAPEEIAEMLIVQDLLKQNNSEEAASVPLIYG
ncbi:hypothetical protein B0G93_11510 [Bacillus sp. V-88]|nr:hypothetical protein B1B00_14355 [Bacillus sp. DSM 27956]PRX75228.1 hypothetical protein B0G93_11510 [Bacillus sp. V-88]SLK23679.1 hypothetical protein SAMN06295884_11510 [Bacillus sp. V-88]